jgi:hypothetical protein
VGAGLRRPEQRIRGSVPRWSAQRATSGQDHAVRSEARHPMPEPSTLRAAGGISYADSFNSEARTLVECILCVSCKWWSPTVCVSVSARRDQFVSELGKQAHTNNKSWLRAMDLQMQTIKFSSSNEQQSGWQQACNRRAQPSPYFRHPTSWIGSHSHQLVVSNPSDHSNIMSHSFNSPPATIYEQ